MSSSIEFTQPMKDGAWRRTEEHFAKTAADGRRDIRMGDAEAAKTEEEALRLVQQIFLVQADEPPRMVVFAGIERSEGCSRICAAVAEALAKNSAGQVCLVEANFRSPILPGLFGTTNHYGLTNALLNKGPIRSFAKPLSADEKLWLVSSGALTADSANLLTSELLRARMAELREEFEYVILDAPPLTRYSDAIATGQCADGLVLVVEAGSTRREAAQVVAANLRTSRIPILGAVLNNRTFPIPEKIYRRL
jgi:Mrp family chromosome partitioning ATPase